MVTKKIKAWRSQRLKAVEGKQHRYSTADMKVSWALPGGTLDIRLLATWNDTEESPRNLATNLPSDVFPIEQVCGANRLRWQLELIFEALGE